MTYSIVARDPETGAVGVAVQTCMIAVGAAVPWACAGVGAVATQAFTERLYGPRCLEAMADGRSAEQALAAAREVDPAAVMRQVGVVDAAGGVAALTGELCVDHAGHHLGAGYAVQANMMASPQVWPAMSAAYESAAGWFPRRLLAALVAGEAAGGDARGGMSAAMLVVDGERRGTRPPVCWSICGSTTTTVRSMSWPACWVPRMCSTTTSARSTCWARATRSRVARDRERGCAAPGRREHPLRARGRVAFNGRVDEGRALMRALVEARPSWSTVLRSFVDKGLFPLPAGLDIDEFLGA